MVRTPQQLYWARRDEILVRTRLWEKENKEKRKQQRKIWEAKNGWYDCLKAARQRCQRPTRKDFKYYGGRGIKCFLTSAQARFLWQRDNAPTLKKASIDRINNDGNYSLDNCRFIEVSENSRLARRRENERSKVG